MHDITRRATLLGMVGVSFLLILGSLAILPAVLQSDSGAGATSAPTGPGLTPFVSEGGNTAMACSDVTTCTTGAITNVDSGDTLVVEVTEFTTSRGDPSAVEAVAAGGYAALTLVGTTTCISGSGHGVSAVYGLTNVAAETSVTFMVNYSTASYYTIHALDVEGVASSPFETAGTGVCSPAAGTTGTASVTTTASADLVILAIEVRASTTVVASAGDTLVNQATTSGADLDSGGMLVELDGSTGSISLSATFSDASWAGLAVALKSSPLVSGTVSPSNAGIDAGQTIALSTTAATGGTPPYTYHWYAPSSTSTCSSGTSISGATGQFYTTPALTVGTYYYCVWVTDSSTPTAEVAYSNVATVTVVSALSVVVDPNAPSIDSGQTVLLTAVPSGGTGADTYAWYAGDTCSGTVLATTQVYTTPALTAGTTYCVAATDSSYTPATATATATVTVSASALTVAITPSAPSIDTGQSIQLSAEPSGGIGPYTFAWYAGSSCSGTVLAVTQNYTSPTLTAGATYCVKVTDSASSPSTANATVTVAVSTTPLAVAIAPSAPAIDQGQSVLLTAKPSGGTGADSFAWYSGSTCSGTALAATQAYTTLDLTANSTFCVMATDSAYVPETATATAVVTVSPSSSPGSGSGSGPGTGSSHGGGLPTYVYPIVGVLAAIIAAALLLALLARRKRKVTFIESGLPEGTKWSVTFNAEVKDSTTSSIAFDRSKGEHPYHVGTVPGYTPIPSSGVVNVGKDPTDLKIAFKGPAP
jgi:hypothetical protein